MSGLCEGAETGPERQPQGAIRLESTPTHERTASGEEVVHDTDLDKQGCRARNRRRDSGQHKHRRHLKSETKRRPGASPPWLKLGWAALLSASDAHGQAGKASHLIARHRASAATVQDKAWQRAQRVLLESWRTSRLLAGQHGGSLRGVGSRR